MTEIQNTEEGKRLVEDRESKDKTKTTYWKRWESYVRVRASQSRSVFTMI
jgi:hypothetical protein